MLKKCIMLFCVLVLTGYKLAAAEADPAIRAKNKAAADRILKENQEKYKANSDMLIFPGLLADRKNRRITLQAEATGLSEGSPVEFFLIGEKSGYAYESLAISFAKPGNVQKALEFTGMQPGRSTDSKKCMFWPKGERVIMTFSSMEKDKPFPPTRAERLIRDSRTKKALPDCGLVFTGSVMIDSKNTPGSKVMAVDEREPNSIASTYNALETIMDMPFSWSQKSVYGSIVINSEHMLKPGCLLEITLEPEFKDGNKRIVELSLNVSARPDSQGKTLEDLELQLRDNSNAILNKEKTLNAVLKEFDALASKGKDPFVSLHFSDNITVKATSSLCGILSNIDTEKGIRIEPPAKNHLYYRAFTPNEKHRNRADRFAQPLELNLSSTNSTVTGILTKIDQIWKDGQVDPELKSADFAVPTPEQFELQLKEKYKDMPVIFVFSDPAVTYGQLMSFIRPVFEAHPIIHVFIK